MPTFSWSGGKDPDNDSVFYRVFYGPSTTSLISQSAAVTELSTGLPEGVTLEPATVYYWQVIAWTKVYNDTVRSAIKKFTTTKNGPAIIEQPTNQQVKAGQKTSFQIAATGSDLSYQWQRDSILITGATSQTCTLSQVSASDNGAHFRCMVYNSVDTTISNSAILTVLHTVSYNANTATGTVPVDTTGYASGSPVTIKSNTDVNGGAPIVKTGCVFGGWNTSSNGSGKTYRTDGTDTMKMPLAPVTLYAKWIVDSCTVTFISTGTTVFQTQKISFNGQATLPATPPVLAGYSFEGWYTTNDASGIPFDFSSSVTVNRTFYAKWAQVYSVTYLANGGSGSVPTDNKKYKTGENVTVLDNTGGMTKNGCDFAGWTLNAQENGTIYTAGVRINVGSENVNLYAKWKPMCTVTFDGQGATIVSSPTAKRIEESTAIGVLPTDPKKTSYTFDGWYRSLSDPSSKITTASIFSGATTVYAKWVIKDADGNIYTEVKFGDQVWIVENLITTKFNDGTPIPLVTDSAVWENRTLSAYHWYDNNIANAKSYGALYNWYVIDSTNTKKIAPDGWHIPTAAEWMGTKSLPDFLNYSQTDLYWTSTTSGETLIGWAFNLTIIAAQKNSAMAIRCKRNW